MYDILKKNKRRIYMSDKNNNQNILTHSLMGNTAGKNDAKTLTSLLNKTTIKTTSQDEGKVKKGSE